LSKIGKFQHKIGFRYHGNKGRSGIRLNGNGQLADSENPLFGAKICGWIKYEQS